MADANIKISASIMCVDWLNAGRDLDFLKNNSIDFLHWDIIDGHFAPDFTMGSSLINTFLDQAPNMASDYHLMVEEPSHLFQSFRVKPGDVFTIHQEACRNLHRDLVNIRKMGCKAGVAISPGTPLETLEYVIEDADVVLIMTVDPGYKGQKLVPQALRKIEKCRSMIENLKIDCKIHVDGNVNPETVPSMIEAGADVLIVGSSGLFRSDMSRESSLKLLNESIQLGLQKRGVA